MNAIPTYAKFAPILAVTLGLAACDRPQSPSPEGVTVEPGAQQPTATPPSAAVPEPPSTAPSPAPAPTPAPPPRGSVTPPPPPPPAPARWDVSRTRQGAVATLSGTDGVLLQISCLSSPPRLRVNVPTFRPVASEDRLSIGFGNDPIALAANLGARGEGVTARGELPPNMSGRILRARTISVNYGRQNAGPFEALRGQGAMTFANACAEAAGTPAPGPGAPGPDGRGEQIPVNFRGEWNTRLQDCGTGRNDSRLIIDARTVRFYESRGEVLGVTRHGPGSITVDARYRGEGETWSRSTRMNLSRGGDQLTMEGMTRQRCSAEPVNDRPRRP